MGEARAITTALRGRWLGRYGSVRCVAHEDRNPSLTLRDGERGRLLVRCLAGCDPLNILAELRRRGLLEDADQQDRQAARDARGQRREREHTDPEADRRRRIEWAQRLWKRCRPATGDTLTAAYLRSRGVFTDPLPATLRHLDQAEHTASGLVLPAMVAGVTRWPGRDIVAVHRTYLNPDGTKADVRPAKATLGPIAGAAVRLAPLISGAGASLIVAEGIETALSVQQATGIPAWAALSAPGIESLVLPAPELVPIVYIAADNDPRGLEAADRAGRRWLAAGHSVRIVAPEEPGADWNDVARTEEGTVVQ